MVQIDNMGNLGKIISINISQHKGIDKTPVKEINLIAGFGLEGDAHGGDWDRQVSIFPIEALEKVPAEKKEEVTKGGFTENITIQGIPLKDLAVGTKLKIGDALVLILHIGKEEYKEQGRPYIVSREGRFGRVIEGGIIRIGDKVKIVHG
ncbi:MAG: MOSC domain-containing protein [Bacillota bacterium]|jgi:MOSC domain-containing protein YiiM